MFGLFLENGPFYFTPNGKGSYNVHNRGSTSWSQDYDIIFIDSPVDTGFSYTSDNDYPTNEDEVSEALWTAT